MFFLRCVQLFRKKKVQPNTVLDVPIPPPVQICNLPGCGEPETAPTPAEYWNRMLKSAGLGVRPYSEQQAWKLLLQADSSDSLVAFAAEASGEVLLERLRDIANDSIGRLTSIQDQSTCPDTDRIGGRYRRSTSNVC